MARRVATIRTAIRIFVSIPQGQRRAFTCGQLIDLRSAARCVRHFFLDAVSASAYVRRVPLTEGVSGDEPESERDAASCGLARNQTPGRRPGNTVLPPLRAGPANAAGQAEGHRSCAPPQGPAQAGSEPKNRRGGAPRGGRPRRADCASGLRGTQGRAISPCGPT
jgi:hypothetical protein